MLNPHSGIESFLRIKIALFGYFLKNKKCDTRISITTSPLICA